ncbi:DUF2842 domain-containing protein [Sandarakinorhabdus sp.]|uniref:DUF2842 domain-containing protein n=1 Tax=Sandarakinorhabdus sp. TaxID=1916663 RepID=UPI00286D8CCE|nr:DUF2842 domain-containing protein [Sandarakinorhabdus sp.]
MTLPPHRTPPEPSWRKPVGMLLMLLYIAVYAMIVGLASGWLTALPTPLMVAAYLVLGVAWLAPLRPLLVWMNTGRWRAGR